MVFISRRRASSIADRTLRDFPLVERAISTSPGFANAQHLPCKDLLKAIVVSDGREKSAIRAQCDGRIWTAIFLEAAGEFGRNVGSCPTRFRRFRR